MSFCIVYLASPRAFHVQGISRHEVLRISLQYTRKCFPTTDIYVFHEDYTDDDKSLLPGVTEFLQVDFRGFESTYNSALSAPRGYLMMCRFFCGVLQSYPQLHKYTHYMRLDDDSFFMAPWITPDMVKSYLAYDYVYRAGFVEQRTQQTLFDFTWQFVQRLGPDTNSLLRRLRQRQIVRDGLVYTGAAPYNNFHIASMRLWNHPIVRQYVATIEQTGSIFRHGWLDANIHAMILYVLGPSLGFTEHVPMTFGYRHNTHVCPPGTMRANADPSLSFCPPALDESPIRELGSSVHSSVGTGISADRLIDDDRDVSEETVALLK
jgi:hypothetical protein